MLMGILIKIITGFILALALLVPYKYKDKMEYINWLGLKNIEIYTIIYVTILLMLLD